MVEEIKRKKYNKVKKLREKNTIELLLPEGKGIEAFRGNNMGINGNERRLNSGWTHNTIYRWWIIEFYSSNVYNLIIQCYHNQFNKNK